MPNEAVSKFNEMFMNSSFTFSGAYGGIYNYAYYYNRGSSYAKALRKGRYANAVMGW